MKLLILGGTIFLGRHVVDAALARGHQVTLFHRGQHGPDLFPGVERLTGDRHAGPEALAAAFHGRRWDAVVDTSAYFPDMVTASARLLSGSADRYCFISSVSVYEDFSKPGLDESGRVSRLTEEQRRRADELRAAGPVRAADLGELYGGLKALCEEAAEAAFPGRALNLRPGLIVGPYDYSNRFTYWVRRMADDGEVLAPGDPARPVQFIDARDLAAWTVRMLEAGKAGVFNATGPAAPLVFGALLEELRAAAGSEAALTWVSDGFLSKHGVGAWIEVPLWTGADPALAGFMSVDCGRARAGGLTFRPVGDTARDTLSWDLGLPADAERKAGLARERERELLASWRARLP